MTTDRPFRVNTKKARSAAAKAECAEELGALFSCMMVRREEEEKIGILPFFGRRRRQTSIENSLHLLLLTFLPLFCTFSQIGNSGK